MKYALIAACVALAPLPAAPAGPPSTFDVSYAAGATDASGRLMGGTEIRGLVTLGGKLFAANGYWKDTPGLAGTPGPRVLVLDAPGARWRIDHELDERLPNGRRRHIAISALSDVTFRTDSRGTALATPVPLLLASTWDVTGRRTVFARDSRTGVFDASLPGQIFWAGTPELATRGLGVDAFPGLAGRLRVSSFAEAGGRLFAAIGQEVWVRQDGPAPQWRRFYTNPAPHYSQTGLRGLTSVLEPGKQEFLLAAVEGNASRIVRIDPVTGAETTDLDLAQFLDASWGTRVSYVIAAYYDMARVACPPAGDDLLIGLEAFIPPASPKPPGHAVLDVIHGLEAGAWFLIRRPGGQYELRQVVARFPGIGQNLVAARSFAVSPFPGEAGTVYVGGYDANDTPAHDTAWIARGVIGTGR